jgi:hypothetical protein
MLVWGWVSSRACPFAEAPSEAEGEVEGSKPSTARQLPVVTATLDSLQGTQRLYQNGVLLWEHGAQVE